MRVGIHQPNFLPWLGIFNRIALVDRFVFFDHVQAQQGKSWFTRNRALVQGEARWLTLPRQKAGQSGQAIKDVRIHYDAAFPGKLLRTLQAEYGRHPHYPEVNELLEGLYAQGWELVADLNAAFITEVARRLELSATFIRSSDLLAVDSSLAAPRGNDLVLKTCQAAGASEYVSGEGCLDFIDPSSFAVAGVRFYFQNFTHPEYPQPHPPFVPNLSVVDALSCVGFAGVAELVRSTRFQPALVAS
jgi:hypothetical protein